MLIFLNDKLVPEPQARVSVFDHGFLYGDGIYETMRSYDGVVFMFDEHLQRLGRSAGMIRLSPPPKEFIKEAVGRTMKENGLSDAYIRVTLSRGKGPIGLDPGLCPRPTFIVMAEPFREYPRTLYESGTKLIIAKTRRNYRGALDPRIKSLNFLNNILARIEANQAGAAEAVMLNPEGFLAEGTVSNLFFVREGALCTPSEDAGILDGITREIVITSARASGLPVREGMFTPADLFAASEVFYTNTSSEVMPVSLVDDTRYRVGEVSRLLHLRYVEAVNRYITHHKSPLTPGF